MLALRRSSASSLPQFARKTSLKSLSSTRSYQYFDEVEIKDNVAVIRFNGPGKMNTISSGMQADVEKIFHDKIIGNKDVKAIVFLSSKPDNFIAGADIDMIKAFENKKDIKPLTMKGHSFFEEVKKMKLPMVAGIHGVALGGGLEWALYCDYRVMTSRKKSACGLPEVKLGLLPGMGGTYHLPRLVGYATALDMILTGKNIRADKAKKMGLFDLVVDPASLEDVCIRQAKGLAEGKVKSHQRKKDWMTWALEDTPLNSMIFSTAKKTVDKQTGGHYPAAYAILDVIEKGMKQSKKDALDYEATKFCELAATPQSDALIGLFHGTTAVKKHAFGKPTHPVQKIAVLGAGLMGAGIAQVSLDQGKYTVLLKDKDAQGVNRGEKVIIDEMKGKLKKKRMSNHEFCDTTSRLIPLHDDVESWKRHFAGADLVIEAVFEEIGVKHKVLQQMESILPSHAIFASNTSAIPIGQIAAGGKHPERVIGMHYFSPVPKMPLLEIILHAGTAPEVAAAAMEVGSRQGKTPIFVKDVAGFFVNRCLAPFMVEVTALVQEGVDLEVIDKAMKSFGMPVGPITLSDEVGIDIGNHVGAFMSKADLGVRMQGGDASMMGEMVKKGWLGRKSGKGFYMYPKEKSKGPKQLNPEMLSMLKAALLEKGVTYGQSKNTVEDIQFRIISKFINEAAFCLQDEIIRAPADGDIGAVFGIGFPPFLGGPFRMLDQQGVGKFVDRMMTYRDSKGAHFEPAQILKDYAKENKKFHA